MGLLILILKELLIPSVVPMLCIALSAWVLWFRRKEISWAKAVGLSLLSAYIVLFAFKLIGVVLGLWDRWS